jgi:hypothetical protein
MAGDERAGTVVAEPEAVTVSRRLATYVHNLPAERTNFAAGHTTGPFHDRSDATSSAPFQVSMVLLDGRLDFRRYDRYDDPAVLDVVGKVEVALVPGRPIRYARLDVTTTDGRVLSAEGEDYAAGGDWLRRIDSDGGWLHRDADLRSAADLVAHLEDVEDVADVLRLLTPAG